MLPSAKCPTADSSIVCPIGSEGLAGETLIESNCDCVTFTVVEDVTPPTVAEIEHDPAACPLMRPDELTVATWVAEEVQFAIPVTSAVLPSL